MKGAEAVWAVAILQPVTVAEVADQFGVPRANADSALRRAWENGYLVRRKRPAKDSDHSANEYALYVPPEEDEAAPTDILDDETDETDEAAV